MPHLAAIVALTNRLLDGADPDERERAYRAVSQAPSIAAATRELGLVERLGAEARDHASAALEALPPSVDAALLAALRSGLERGAQVVLQWKQGVGVEVHVWEAGTGAAATVGVLIVTPPGRELSQAGI